MSVDVLSRTARLPQLTTDRSLLRGLVVADAGELARVTRNVAHPERLVGALPATARAARRWIEARELGWQEQRVLTLGIFVGQPERLVGAVTVKLRLAHGRGELSYWIEDDEAGHGLTTEAAAALVRWCFESLGLARLHARCTDDNAGSRAVLRKLGLVPEGVRRQHLRVRGRARDVHEFGLLLDEWDQGLS